MPPEPVAPIWITTQCRASEDGPALQTATTPTLSYAGFADVGLGGKLVLDETEAILRVVSISGLQMNRSR